MLGAFSGGQLPTEIGDMVFARNAGDVSDAIRTKNGFVILQALNYTKLIGTRAHFGQIQILTDTQGIDFGPYLSVFKQSVQRRWLILISDSITREHARLMIQLRILKDGQLDRVKMAASSGR